MLRRELDFLLLAVPARTTGIKKLTFSQFVPWDNSFE